VRVETAVDEPTPGTACRDAPRCPALSPGLATLQDFTYLGSRLTLMAEAAR